MRDLEPNLGAKNDVGSAGDLTSIAGELCMYVGNDVSCTSAGDLTSISGDISASDDKNVGSATIKMSAGYQASISGDMCAFGNNNFGSATKKLSASDTASISGQLCVSVGEVSDAEDLEKQVRLMQELSHGQEDVKEAAAGVGDQSKVDAGGPVMLEFGFKSLEEALTRKFEGVRDKLELEFKTEILDGIQCGSGDLREMFDLSGDAGEMPNSIGGLAELGLEKEESLVGTVLPPGAEKDIS